MQFGTIGAGAIAQAVSRHVLTAGRGHPQQQPRTRLATGTGAELGPRASAGTIAEAAAADMVLLAVPWDRVRDAASTLPVREGRIVIDTTNQFSLNEQKLADLGDLTGSEFIGSLIPGARIIQAFNTLYARYVAADPRHDAGRQVIFYAGDDADAKDRFRELLDTIGFAPVDLGLLRGGGRLMQIDGGPLSALHVLRQD